LKFFLMRHVETTGNAENRFAGVTETEYTPKGQKQFETIVHKKADGIDVDASYASPISRARKIAEKIGEKKDLPVHVEDALKEMNFGIFENMHYKEVEKKHEAAFRSWCDDYLHYKIPDGDNLIEFHQRVACFVDRIKEQEGSALIVCHGGPIQSMITHLLGLSIEQRWLFHIPLGGMVEIHYEYGRGTLFALEKLVK